MTITRRRLIDNIARLGSAAAVYEALVAWDFLRPPAAQAQPLELPRGSGAGKKVVILGAGVAGLCAAYELDRAGYDCEILEASSRAGGRSLTLRRGDKFSEAGGPVQECRFDEGLYLNAGPGRIPHHHVHVIDYCRRFSVALQPYIFASRANLVHSSHVGNGRTMQVRRAAYDLQGHVAELLDKCVARPDMDLPIARGDLEKFRDMLARFGDLTKTERDGQTVYTYRNAAGRAGYEITPGLATEPGRPLSPLALDEILRSKVWDDYIFRDAEFFWQTSLLEPVGGMDNFFKAFLRQKARRRGTIANLIRTNAKVTEIDVKADGVTVAFIERGRQRSLRADFCISTIPVPIFKTLKTNLPAAYMEAARKLPVQAAGKVGWQAERFWETKDQIYGGISWTTDLITQVWYPSHGYLSRKGTLTGAYMYGAAAEEFCANPVAERLRIAKAQGDKLHDGYSNHVEHGLAIGWHHMEFERMGWADEGDPGFAAPAQALATPQGRFLMAGDQLTYWSGWQEGRCSRASRPSRRSTECEAPNPGAADARRLTLFRQDFLGVQSNCRRSRNPIETISVRCGTLHGHIHPFFPTHLYEWPLGWDFPKATTDADSMGLDVNTLFLVTIYVEAMLGLLLLFAWVQNPGIHAVAWWGSAHLLRAGSVCLFGMFGSVSNAIAIDLANALLFTAFAVTWSGARVFDGRRVLPIYLVGGAVLWLLASRIPFFADSMAARVLLSSAIITGYTWATAYEFWRGRHEPLVSRWPAIFMLFAHGALFLLRTPLSQVLPWSPANQVFDSVWLTVLSFEALLFTIAIAFILLAMAKERTELRHKTAALVDPLTGIANRRAFLEEAAVVAQQREEPSQPTAVLLADLDHFKSINDRFGHAVGDVVLQVFAEIASAKLGPHDLIGRLGGEEFAMILHDAGRDKGLAIADRIRLSFADAALDVDGEAVGGHGEHGHGGLRGRPARHPVPVGAG